MINIYLPNTAVQLQESILLSEALEHLKALMKISTQHFAIVINQCFVPRSLYTKTVLREGDHIDFIFPMQGG